MFSYLFGKRDKKETPMVPITDIKKGKVKTRMASNRKEYVYVVVNKNSQQPLGVFDTLDAAKKEGEKVSYYNCSIFKFKINEKCNYLCNPVFENN